jgi:hypothetical protein
MIDAQSYVTSMCESVEVMKITARQKDFIKAAFRAAIEYANAKHGMHATKEAKAAAALASDQL